MNYYGKYLTPQVLLLIITFLLSFIIINQNIQNNKLETLQEKVKIQTEIINENRKVIDSIKMKIDDFDEFRKKYEEKIEKISQLIHKINRDIDSNTAEIISYNIIKSSIKYKVPVYYIVAVAWTESHFRYDAYNEKTGCIGIMQINPNVWISNNNLSFLLYNIPVNIDLGTRILRKYYDMYGRWDIAIIAYYGWNEYSKTTYKRIVFQRVFKIKKYISS